MNTTWIILLIALIQFAWLWALVAHLKSEDIESTEKICWTVVLCVLNAFGLVLYIAFGSKVNEKVASEEELKRALNEGRR